MKRPLNRMRLCSLIVGILLAPLCVASCGGRQQEGKEFVLLTTTTTRDSGILDELTADFEKRTGYRAKPVVTGSGDVLKQAARGEGDVVLSHSPEAEKKWLAEGYGTSRRLVMYNDFIVVGLAADPATIKGQPAAEALKRIAAAKSLFVSRGDQSGTHARELSLWKRAGVDPKGQPWYHETGQGQGLTMDVAAQKKAYALTDRGTFLVHQKRLELVLLVENDPALFNLYHVMLLNTERFPKVHAKAGQAFADYLMSAEGQQVLAAFGKEKFGRSLFLPAADKKEEDLLTP